MNRRGQTTLDFLIGTSTFLIAIGIIIAFVPGMIDPFTVGTEGHSVMANRAVDTLAQSELAEPEEPYMMKESAVDAVLNNSTDTAAIKNRLGLGDSVDVNVTLTNDTTTKWRGPSPPDSRSVTSAWRVVTYGGDRAELTVRVW